MLHGRFTHPPLHYSRPADEITRLNRTIREFPNNFVNNAFKKKIYAIHLLVNRRVYDDAAEISFARVRSAAELSLYTPPPAGHTACVPVVRAKTSSFSPPLVLPSKANFSRAYQFSPSIFVYCIIPTVAKSPCAIDQPAGQTPGAVNTPRDKPLRRQTGAISQPSLVYTCVCVCNILLYIHAPERFPRRRL